MLLHNLRGTEVQKKSQAAENNREIVQLADADKKIRHEVNRQNHVGKYSKEE
jgi:hypothetical protein